MITLSQNSGMAGLFQIEKHTVDGTGREIPGSRKIVSPWGKNLITNSGLNNMAALGFMARCMIGAGNAEPAVSDTQLGSQLGVVTGTVVQGPSSAVEGYNSIVGTYVFGQGVGEGIIAELGVAPASGNITTRALIKDEGGSPTTIVKGPMDVLTVTYQIREYPSQTDAVSQVVNPHTSVEYTVVSRSLGGTDQTRLFSWHHSGPIFAGNTSFPTSWGRFANAPLQAWDAAPNRAGEVNVRPSIPSYVSGSYVRDAVFTLGESHGNVAEGISRFNIGSSGSPVAGQPFFMQASFDPPIDKDNTKTLILTARKSWGRYEP